LSLEIKEILKYKEANEPTSFVILSGLEFKCLLEVTKPNGTGETEHQNSLISMYSSKRMLCLLTCFPYTAKISMLPSSQQHYWQYEGAGDSTGIRLFL